MGLLHSERKNGNVLVRHSREKDVEGIAKLEKEIEGENAATLETLTDRFKMFPEGVVVAEHEREIVGYAEFCRWNLTCNSFDTFEEIKNFRELHRIDGINAYVIFLATHPSFRKNGIATSLLYSAFKYSTNNGVQRIQLVARPELKGFYSKLGMNPLRELPNFLPYSSGIFMERAVR